VIRFGWPEAVLIGLFVFGLFRKRIGSKWKKALRWVSLGTGLVLLGFVLNRPLNLVFINKILVGDWPAWQLNIYWYILFGGVVLFVLLGKPSPYCEGFCPFGAAQECLGAIGGGRPPGRKLNRILKWIQRGLAAGLVLAALIFRNPSLLNFEVSGTLFHLIGSTFQFGLLAAVLIASLFIARPWCRGLCPVRPVTDFLRWMRDGFSGSVTRASDNRLD
jgi:polyferredoxin